MVFYCTLNMHGILVVGENSKLFYDFHPTFLRLKYFEREKEPQNNHLLTVHASMLPTNAMEMCDTMNV